MIARFLNVKVWELDKVAIHYQEEAAIILQGQFEAKKKMQKDAIKAGAMNIEVFLPEF